MLLKDFKIVSSIDELRKLGYEPDDFTRKAFERGAEVGLLIDEDNSAVVVSSKPVGNQTLRKGTATMIKTKKARLTQV